MCLHTYVGAATQALMHTYIYTCDCSNAQLCLRGQLDACMSMPHIHPSQIDFIPHTFTIRTSRTLLFLFRFLRFLIERRY